MTALKKLVFVFVLTTGVVFSSCNKKEEENPGVTTNGTLSLKHDGSNWSATLSVQAVNSGGVVNVTGSDSNANQGAISVYNASGPGTYKIGLNGDAGNLGRWTQGTDQNDSYVASYVIGGGEVTFTELSATAAKGTFHFEGYNTVPAKVVVTEGSFAVTF